MVIENSLKKSEAFVYMWKNDIGKKYIGNKS